MKTPSRRWAIVGVAILVTGGLLSGCGFKSPPATTASPGIHVEKAVPAPLGPSPKNWPTDHRSVSNLAPFVKPSTGTGPSYVVSFPYKLASDTPIAHGVLYLTSGNVSGSSHPSAGTVWAVNPQSGQVIWRRTLPNTAFAEPIISQGRVYVGVGNIAFPRLPGSPNETRGTGVSGVWVFSAHSGRPLWHFTTTGSDQPPVTVTQGVVYLASGNRILYALKARTGALQWSLGLHCYVSRSGPRVVGHMLYVGGASPSTVVAVNLLTHQVVWRTVLPNTQAGVDDTPLAYSHGMLVTAGIAVPHDVTLSPASSHHLAQVYGIAANTGQVRWTDTVAEGTMPDLKASGTPVIRGGIVYAGNAINGTVTAASLQTGRVLWTFNAQAPVKKPPVVSAHALYLVNLHGTLFKISRAGHLLAHRSVGEATNVRGPVLINHTLFVVLNTATQGYLWAEPTRQLS
ncbi:MAG: PQQ-binding-like beta-propeller repeat protein [Firmicutes bacterium]|nr:PQQ-binding-like beta-propeller repeat protein [Bacillota bacterium]